MKNLVTKRNITILNLALLGIFLITLAAVAISSFKDKPMPPFSERRSVARAERTPAMSAPVEMTTYTCPRHPDVKSKVPGKCTQCDTVLEKVERYAAIPKRNLFYDERIRPKPIPPTTPIPPLQLELVGVTKMPDGYVAVIRDKTKRSGRGFVEHILGEGDELPGYFGVTILSVIPNPPSVKYERAGVGIEELKMGDIATAGAGPQKDLWQDIIRPIRKDYTYLVKYKELQARNLTVEGIRQTIGLEPVVEGTRVTGLRITSLPRNSLLYAAGLKQGDVIDSINTKPITDEASAMEQLKAASGGLSIQVGITRARNKRTLIYTLLKK